jgi:hypothetical protein
VELEDEIEMFDLTVQEMNEKCQAFRIGNINHKLGESTSIFDSTGPVKKEKFIKKPEC